MRSNRLAAPSLIGLGASLAALLAGGPPARAASLCPGRLVLTARRSSFAVPYCTNRSLHARAASVRRLVVVVHGTQRNAADYERFMTTAARRARVSDAVIVAPQFPDASDHPSRRMLRWTSNGWKQGDESQTSPSISSFAVVDQLVKRIVGGRDFPGLSEVVIAGHSAGGQFVERYAASNRVDGSLRVPMRYVVANPSSYLYLSADRPATGSTTRFVVPSARACRGYDTYKYGLDRLNPYLASVGAARIRGLFRSRRVAYLLGGADTDPHDSSLDRTCSAELQGANRLQRGESFFGYLGHYYGRGVYARQSETIVPGVAHDAAAMFGSARGRRVLFRS